MLMNRSTGHPPNSSINPALVNFTHALREVWRFIQFLCRSLSHRLPA
jgi:hypothetical protein